MKNENSHLVSKARCPNCARLGMDTRGDNLAIYSDGHEFCYACNYIHTNLHDRISNSTEKHAVLNKGPVLLPRDIDINYPSKVIDWTASYDLTTLDLHNHNFLWSEYYQRLLYPVWSGEDVIFWTGRYFGPDQKQSKWLNKGSPKDIVHCINKHANTIVVVEDIISAIKILKTDMGLGVLVLFNSHNPVSKLLKIGKNKQYFLWLDNDKFKESIFFVREAVSQGFSVMPITSDRDPKDETIESIRRILNVQRKI